MEGYTQAVEDLIEITCKIFAGHPRTIYALNCRAVHHWRIMQVHLGDLYVAPKNPTDPAEAFPEWKLGA